MAKPTRKFRSHWALLYALAVVERDPQTNAPTKAVCLMCRAFERDETEGSRRRKPKMKVHCFSPPWRPDNMRRHLEQQHALRWRQYRDISDEDKRRFFPTNVAISTRPRDTMTSLEVAMTKSSELVQPTVGVSTAIADAGQRPRTVMVDEDIVDELLHGVEGDGVDFCYFKKQEIEMETDDEDRELDVDENESRYTVRVDSKLEMDTCVKFVGGGVSFKQAAELYEGMAGDVSALEEATETRVMNLCRVVCAVNLQKLRNVLKKAEVWAFALELEFCMCAGSSFIDVRVRFEHSGEVYSGHLVGIVDLSGDRTKENTELVMKYLDVVVPNWKRKLIGISCMNDDKSRIRECMQRVTSRLAAECEGPIYGDYNLAAKLDHLMCEVCRVVLTVEFTNTLIGLISHLRSLKPVHSETLTCPNLIEGSWRSLVRALHWIMENQEYVIEFTCKYQYPEPAWWVLALVLTKVADQVNSVSQQLRTGKGFQRDRQQLANLMNQLLMLSGAVGPIVPSDVFSISCEGVVIGSFSLNPMAVSTFLKAQGDFVNSAVDSLEPNDYQTLLDVTSTFVLTVLSKLNQIVSDSTSACKDSSSMIYQAPGFLPDALGKMRHQDFVGVMQQQRFRLGKFFSIEEIDMIETQHRAIRRGYLVDKNVRAELDYLSAFNSFSEGWQEGFLAGLDCRLLRRFCGPLAAVGSTPSSMDSEFLLLNWSKVPFTQVITDFHLEAILHAQNYSRLADISVVN
ncbi:hypothetical protein P3T76_012512 [Phytophthora citrophthora]|uniref:Uncharacterized protein n=1 Tax=Phytophthora citrophthora TaxID=4793 RepID=A0AAD9G4U2_9STRA|nr:hypothetical protein P3T76_012512 [Phytophthora citrophthora]